MRLLLDTQSFIWWMEENSRLAEPAMTAIADRENDVFLSVVSSWELALLVQRQRIQIPAPLPEYVRSRVASNSLQVLPVTLPHTFAVFDLPAIHRDPFDRMLIAQAIVEGLVLVTSDRAITQYDVPVLLAHR